jgi:hypothetical protein
MSTILVSELDGIFSTTYNEKEMSFKEDPLVLAVSLKDLMNRSPGSYYSIEDPRVLENVNDDIRTKSEQIRKYYGRKYFWSNLSNNQQLSGFRSRVCYLLENRIRTCKDKDAGIYYKLPYFYDEDMIYDEFKKQYNTTDVPRIGSIKTANTKHQLTLTYLKTTSCRQQKRNLNRFWFTDNKYLYNIEIANDNPLLELFKQLVVEKITVNLDTCSSVDRIDQMYFYKLFNFTLAKEQHEVS